MDNEDNQIAFLTFAGTTAIVGGLLAAAPSTAVATAPIGMPWAIAAVGAVGTTAALPIAGPILIGSAIVTGVVGGGFGLYYLLRDKSK
jgi:hypothetical protein